MASAPRTLDCARTAAGARVKVLFRTRHSAPHDSGGDYLQLLRTVEPLRALGVECVISNDPLSELASFDLIHLYGLGDPRTLPRYLSEARAQNKRIVTTPIYWRHDAMIAARKKPKRYPEFALDALAPSEQARVRRIQTLEEKLYDAAQKMVCDTAEIIFPQSHAEAEMLQKNFDADAKRIRIAPNAADVSYAHGNAERFFQRYGLRDFVLCIARFQGYKNQTNLIRAWQDQTVPLVFVGPVAEPGYLEWCRRLANSNTVFLGTLSPPEIADACAAAAVHVLSSWYEVVGMAAIEAALASCRIVMTQESPAREYFGDHCFLCDPDDPVSIRTALEMALKTPRTPELAAFVREQFAWKKTAELVANAYSECLAHLPLAYPPTYTAQMEELTNALLELGMLNQPRIDALETQLREQQVWESSLLQRQAQMARERAQLLNLAPIKLARKVLGKFG